MKYLGQELGLANFMNTLESQNIIGINLRKGFRDKITTDSG